jgi:two-component system, LuxR family, response regulator FixJ
LTQIKAADPDLRFFAEWYRFAIGEAAMSGHQQASAGKPLVIIVDDDHAVRDALKFWLEVEGFSVRTYAAGVDLLNETALPTDGCLVIDQNMPGMKGLELVSRLRERALGARAILVTSDPSATVRERAARARVPIVEKPLLGTGLIDLIRTLLCQAAAQAST